jgi:FkbM family methyltransferase
MRIPVKTAWRVFKEDGPRIAIMEILRYLGFAGTPAGLLRYYRARRITPQVIKEIQGSRMLLNLRDKGIHMDLFINGIREPLCTNYLKRVIKPDMVVLDIGANIGYFALIQARIAKKVIALEPDPDNFKALQNNINLNGYTNMKIHNIAAGSKDGKIGFHIGTVSNWRRIATKNHKDNIIEVPIRIMDNFLKDIGQKEIDYIRMDTEGYELDILKGLKNTLANNKLGLFIETHRYLLEQYGYSQLELMEFLANYNFNLTQAFIPALPLKDNPKGNLVTLLGNPRTRKLLTKTGSGAWMFFSN